MLTTGAIWVEMVMGLISVTDGDNAQYYTICACSRHIRNLGGQVCGACVSLHTSALGAWPHESFAYYAPLCTRVECYLFSWTPKNQRICGFSFDFNLIISTDWFRSAFELTLFCKHAMLYHEYHTAQDFNRMFMHICSQVWIYDYAVQVCAVIVAGCTAHMKHQAILER